MGTRPGCGVQRAENLSWFFEKIGRETMKYEIKGTMLPSVDVHMEAGESVYTERGGMAWMRGDIEMSTSTRGGLLKGLGRKLAGESLFMTTYACKSATGMITFTPEAPGGILAWPRR